MIYRADQPAIEVTGECHYTYFCDMAGSRMVVIRGTSPITSRIGDVGEAAVAGIVDGADEVAVDVVLLVSQAALVAYSSGDALCGDVLLGH